MSYSKKYHHVLTGGDESGLVVLSLDKRTYIMWSLATLLKFLGCYGIRKDIVENYQKKGPNNGKGAGATPKGLEVFHNICGKKNYQDMIVQLREACSKLDKKYSSAFLYCTLTGLRSAESCVSFKLHKERKVDFLTKDNKILENLKFQKSS